MAEVAEQRPRLQSLTSYCKNFGWEVKLRPFGDTWEIVTRHDKLLDEHASRSILANRLRKLGYGPLPYIKGTWTKRGIK